MNFGMTVKLWGVRGSIPSPGPDTAIYGGNTSCVSVETDDLVLILDAGTGIRRLGIGLDGDPRPITILLTHLHWDHVQGLMFFGPLHERGRTIALETPDRSMTSLEQIAGVDGVHFPLTVDKITSDLRINQGAPVGEMVGGLCVRRLRVNHPGLCDGIRVECSGHALVFIPDNEINPLEKGPLVWDDLVAFCRGADVLIHDAQYREVEMSAKRGWGHSTVDEACRLGVAAQVKHLVLFHHDPERTDRDVDAIVAGCRARMKGAVEVSAAAEGMTFAF